jgi:hypothetical protein
MVGKYSKYSNYGQVIKNKQWFLNLKRHFSFCIAKRKVPRKGLGNRGGV